MSVRAPLRSFFQGVSQTLVVSLVLLALFNSAIWAPALEANSADPSGPDSSAISVPRGKARPLSSLAQKAPPDSTRLPAPVALKRVSFQHQLASIRQPFPSAVASLASSAVASSASVDTTPSPSNKPAPTLQATAQRLGEQGPVFIENQGQFHPRVKFQVKTRGGTLWLTDDGIVFDSVRPKEVSPGDALPQRLKARDKLPQLERLVFQQKFVAPNSSPRIEARDPLPGIYNYFYGSDPNKWRSHVKGYTEVTYHNVWSGVDLTLRADGPDLEEAFIVHPGADPAAVRLAYLGVKGVGTNDDGSLKVVTAFGDLIETKPRIYQEKAGKSVPVDGHFNLTGNGYTFEVAMRDETADLIIDPTIILSQPAGRSATDAGILLYSSFLGGSGLENGGDLGAIAVDSSGNAYLAGYTTSTDFPTVNAYQDAGYGVFVTKVNPLGSAPLVYSTYLGVGAVAYGIAVDSSGSAYVVGRESGPGGSAFPVTANAYSQTCGDYNQGGAAFLTKFTPAGDNLLYSTCFGGITAAHAVAVDANGLAYLTGSAGSYESSGGELPTTPTAYQQQFPGCDNYTSAFFSVLNPSASGSASLTYSSYLGAQGINCQNINYGDSGQGVAVDAYGMAYVTGLTSAPTFPVTTRAYQTMYESGRCENGCLIGHANLPSAFIAKFNPQVSGVGSLIYSTYLGGSLGTGGNGIAVDTLGNAYVTGTTGGYFGSPNQIQFAFPTTDRAYQRTPDGNDAFVTKLNAAGNKLVYSTLLGGSQGNGTQLGFAIALDSQNDAYVTGYTGAPNFPTTPNAYQQQNPNPSFAQAFVTKFNSNGSNLVYSSYLGGHTQASNGSGIAVDQVGDAYVTGITNALDFPVTSSAFQPVYAGNGDAFVTKFPIGASSGVTITGIVPPAGGNAGTVTATVVGSGFLGNATLELDCPGQNIIQANNVNVSSDTRTISGTFDLMGTNPGSCTVQVMNDDGTGASAPHPFTIEAGGAPQMWIDIVGLRDIRGGSPENYYVVYGNSGNVDAQGIVVSIETPNILTWTLLPGQVPIYQIQQGGNTLRAFAVPVVPPQGSAAIVISLTGPPVGHGGSVPFQFSAWMNPK